MSATTTTDELAKLRERLERREDRAGVRSTHRARRDERVSAEKVSRLKRRALLAGERARTRHEVAQSAEARAMRVERTRGLALLTLLPVLAAFGGWSTAGVQAGMVNLLDLQAGTATAAAAWLVEPALLGTVAGIILIRARLRSAGGDLDERATRIEVAALSVSILLNMAGHWPDSLSWSAVGNLVGHSLGPVGAAGTALLISIVQDGVTNATPWKLPDGTPAPRLAALSEPARHDARDDARDGARRDTAARPVTVWPVPVGGRRTLPIVSRPTARGDIQRDTGRDTGRSVRRAIEAPKATRRRPVSRDTGRTAGRDMSDADRATKARALLAAEPDMSGAELGRRLGLSARQGQRLLAEVRDAAPVPGQMSLDAGHDAQSDTGPRETRTPAADTTETTDDLTDDAPRLSVVGGDR